MRWAVTSGVPEGCRLRRPGVVLAAARGARFSGSGLAHLLVPIAVRGLWCAVCACPYCSAMTEEAMRLHASDVRPTWEDLVGTAVKRVRVFTPYFDDRVLPGLVDSAAVSVEAFAVVTDLSPASGAVDYRKQLLGARKLLEMGVDLRSLPRLHAKVLQVDDDVVLGSQNFTAYATRSREVSASGIRSRDHARWARTLDGWFDAAEPVDADFIEHLLATLEDEMRAATAARRALLRKFDDVRDAHQVEKQLRSLPAAVRAAVDRGRALAEKKTLEASIAGVLMSPTVRRARGVVMAELRYVEEDSVGGGDHWSLMIDRDATLLDWWVPDGAGAYVRRALTAKRMYAALLPGGRMGFLRVNAGRITYVRTRLTLSGGIRRGVRRLSAEVQFPRPDKFGCNAQVVLTAQAGRLVLRLRFDGESLQPVGVELQPNGWWPAAALEDDADYYLNDPDGQRELQRVVFFKGFKYTELGIRRKNADEFFKGGTHYLARLIMFGEQPVLVIT